MNSKVKIAAGLSLIGVIAAACSSTSSSATSTASSSATSYPSRRVSVIVANPAGSATDLSARAVTKCMGGNLKETFQVTDEPAGSGTSGMLAIKNSSANGYTLGAIAISNILEPVIDPSVGYLSSDYIPIGLLAAEPVLLLVDATSPYQSASQFLSAAKSASVSIGDVGANTVAGLTSQALISAGKLGAKLVTYDANGQAVDALLGGHVSAIIAPYDGAVVGPQIKAGKVRVLATAAKASFLPSVPTFSSLFKGLPPGIGFWYLGAPKGTPSAVINILTKAMKSCMSTPAVQKVIGASVYPGYYGATGVESLVSSSLNTYAPLLSKK